MGTLLASQSGASVAKQRGCVYQLYGKWCLVCLLNDKSSLSTDEFKQLTKNKNIRLFKADWTNRDERIRDALKTYGRNSIPLYVYYPQGSRAPIILPQILTVDILREKLGG